MNIVQAENRSPSVRHAVTRFETEHITDPDARQIAMECARLAALMLTRIRIDDDELIDGLRDLADARDSFIIASQAQRQSA